jgi:protein involved in polysaccharide export with SLBB domain
MMMVVHPAGAQMFEGDGPPVVIPKLDMSVGGMTNTASAPGVSKADANGLPSIRSVNSDDRSGSGGGQAGATMQTLKPLPPNDFQKFIQESTGQSLPLFGSALFLQTGSYQPLANVPVSPDYAVGPGDEVLVRGWGAVDIDVKTVVDRNGLIHLPRVGAVSVGGVKSSQLTGVLQTAVGRYFKDFSLSVTMGQLRGITVYVVGQARKPGAYTMPSVSTLVTALFVSGGPNSNGSMRHVQVRRADKVVAELDLYQFITKGEKANDVKLMDGDTIVIPQASGYVALAGKVNNPAVYELATPQESIDNLLAIAGGLPVMADTKRATLERVDPFRKPARSVESFALDQSGLARKLANGDLLTVSSLAPEFGNAVTLRGNVDQSLRLPWFKGMHIHDLIPSRQYLVSRASVKRQNDAVLSAEQRRRAEELDSSTKTPVRSGAVENGSSLAPRIGGLVDEVNFDYAVVERFDREKVAVKLMPFNLGQALDEPNGSDDLVLEPGDVVTVFSVNDIRVPLAKRQIFVQLEGEVARPGVYQLKSGDNLQTLISTAGGLTPDAYVFGTELYREDVRRAQAENLEQLVRRMESQAQARLSSVATNTTGADSANVVLRYQAEMQAQKQALDRLRTLKPSGRINLGLNGKSDNVTDLPGLRLEPMDRIVIPSRPDFVHVIGAVNTESALIWKRGASVQYYLERSGLTSGAEMGDLFIIRADGSVLSDSDHWFSRLTSAEVLPGDLIVLPEKTDHESAWSVFTRNAKDITQIIYQLSLGAAAIKTLRN